MGYRTLPWLNQHIVLQGLQPLILPELTSHVKFTGAIGEHFKDGRRIRQHIAGFVIESELATNHGHIRVGETPLLFRADLHVGAVDLARSTG